MPVEDVFSITGRGTVATGRIETGVIQVGDEIEILGLGEDKKSVVTGVEMFRKLLDQGEAGDNVGLLLRGVDKNEIKRGMVLCKPGQIKPHSKFKAEVYIMKKEEGGRHTPFHNKYRPQFYLRTMDCTGEITLPEGTEMVMPGDNVEINVELIYPVALNVGLRNISTPVTTDFLSSPKPGQIKPHSKFKAEVYILKKEEGGRHTPFHNKYRPQFYLRTMDCTGEITLPEGTEMVMPGDNVTITVELIYPVALNPGLRFAIREGGRTVGAGQITEIID